MPDSNFAVTSNSCLCETQLRADLAAAVARNAVLEKRLAEATTQLERREHQLRALLHGLPVGLVLVSPAGEIELVNPGFRAMFGLKPGHTLSSTYAPHSPDTVSIGPAFRDPAAFARRARALHQAGQTVMGEAFELANGRMVELDYLVLDGQDAGRLICYRDVTEHHEDAAQVRLLSRIPQQNPHPILCLTPDGEVLYANSAAADIAQALAVDAPAFWVTELLGLVQQTLAASQPRQHELLIGEKYFLCAAQLLPGDTYATVFLSDITTHYQAEQRLAEQRAFYETILAKLPISIGVVDEQLRYIYINHLGLPDPALRAQALGKTIEEFGRLRQRPDHLVAERNERLAVAIREQRAVSWEETFIDDSRQFSLLINAAPVFSAAGPLDFLIITSVDITERKASEERQHQSEVQLREQQDFVRMVVDALPSVIYVISPEGEVQFQNSTFTNLSNQAEHQLPLQQQSEAVREQLAKIAGWRQQVIDTGQALNTELPLLLSSGAIRHLQVHMTPLLRPDGGRNVLVVSSDITALKEAREAAESNAQAKESFLSRMSHEIRIPLNGLLGMAQLLRQTPLTVLQQEYLHTMQHSGRHLLALVNDVLDLAKITNQPLELVAAPFDLTVLLQGANETVANLAAQKDLELVVKSVPATIPSLLGDAYRLQQVLLNLLSNAIKFTERGSVRLGVAVLREQPKELSLRFWVQDTGAGIAPEQQEHIFESFAQASTDTSARFGGTGLGLAISQQLVQQMGGMLRLCSQPGVGTTFAFVLTLPRASATPGTSGPEPAVTPAVDAYQALRGLRVLLAEDNAVNLFIARSLLEQRGVEVRAVTTGAEALQQLTCHEFDAALLDIRMPDMSGVDVAQALRRHPDSRRANIPLLAFTANAFEADKAAYLAAGMNCCVTKPLEETELFDWLLRLTRSDSAVR